jgi:hypothetical protein
MNCNVLHKCPLVANVLNTASGQPAPP